MQIKIKLNVFLLSYFFVLGCQKLVICESFTNQIMINGRPHSITGKTILINNVRIEYYSKIPYAKPPIGKLRFKHPQEIDGDSWTGVYNSTVKPNTCWQADGSDFDKLNPAARLWLSKTEMSEDCLYLTVWVPKTDIKKLPVMVWIYGGAFLSGSSTLEVYDGSILASKHQVIVVSLQYRLGPLGFLYFSDTFAPGNQGLMDQRQALKWIKNNIKSFNGDENKITIFGESAGSASVSFHVISPLSENLFNRAIMESGSALAHWAIESKFESKSKTIELAKYANCGPVTEDMVQMSNCLMNLEPSLLVNLQFGLKDYIAKERLSRLMLNGLADETADASYLIDIYFKPIYDDFFIPKNILQLLGRISSKKIELLMGFNTNEGMYFLLYGLNKSLNFFDGGNVRTTDLLSSSNINSRKVSDIMIRNLINSKVLKRSLILSLMYEYRIPSYEMGYKKWTSLEVLSALDQMLGDENFVCPVVKFGEIMAENNKNVYMYNFQHRTEAVTFPKWVGTMHGYEIEYIFGMPFSELFKKRYYKFSKVEEELSNRIMTLWTNFAKYGNPTPDPINYFGNTVSWLPYNTTNQHMFHLSTSNQNPFKENEKSYKCKFWTKVIPSFNPELMSLKMPLSWNIIVTLLGLFLSIVL